MGPKSRNKCPYKREAEGDLRHRRLCDNRGRDWREASTSQGCQGMPAAARSQERGLESMLPQGLLKEPNLRHPEFGLLASRAGRGPTAAVVSSPSGGTWLQQPRETKALVSQRWKRKRARRASGQASHLGDEESEALAKRVQEADDRSVHPGQEYEMPRDPETRG